MILVVVDDDDAVWGCTSSRLTVTVRVKASVKAWQSHWVQAVLKLAIKAQLYVGLSSVF